MKLDEALNTITTGTGQTISQLSLVRPQLVVFLRHTGCTFCRQTLADLAKERDQLEHQNIGLVLVHQSDQAEGAHWFAQYGLAHAEQISDPETKLYKAFELGRASLTDIFRPSVWWNGFRAAILQGHWFGKIVGDVFQLPGVFLIDKGKIVRAYRHQFASDRPNYSQFACPIEHHSAHAP